MASDTKAPILAPAPAPAPAPRSVIPPPASQRVSMPAARVVGPRSVFDAAPASITASRAQAASARQSLGAALQSLRSAAKAGSDAAATIKGNADAATVFAHEGLTPEVLAKFDSLAAPLLEAFTA